MLLKTYILFCYATMVGNDTNYEKQ